MSQLKEEMRDNSNSEMSQSRDNRETPPRLRSEEEIAETIVVLRKMRDDLEKKPLLSPLIVTNQERHCLNVAIGLLEKATPTRLPNGDGS
jgi:hypothetical protein